MMSSFADTCLWPRLLRFRYALGSSAAGAPLVGRL